MLFFTEDLATNPWCASAHPRLKIHLASNLIGYGLRSCVGGSGEHRLLV